MSLRPLSDDDVQAVSWLDEALLSRDGEALAIICGGELVGALQHRAGEPKRGWLAFDFVGPPTADIGIGYPEAQPHAPNENIRVEDFFEGRR